MESNPITTHNRHLIHYRKKIFFRQVLFLEKPGRLRQKILFLQQKHALVPFGTAQTAAAIDLQRIRPPVDFLKTRHRSVHNRPNVEKSCYVEIVRSKDAVSGSYPPYIPGKLSTIVNTMSFPHFVDYLWKTSGIICVQEVNFVSFVYISTFFDRGFPIDFCTASEIHPHISGGYPVDDQIIHFFHNCFMHKSTFSCHSSTLSTVSNIYLWITLSLSSYSVHICPTYE